jgi:hypothetical protein
MHIGEPNPSRTKAEAMRKPTLSVVLLLVGFVTGPTVLTAKAPEATTDVPRTPLDFRTPIQDKNFYLLSLLESTAGVAKVLANDPELAALAKRKLSAEDHCGASPTTCVDAASFSPEEVARVNGRLLAALQTEPAVKGKIIISMRKSGLFELYASDTDSELLSKAWSDAARGVNRILGVYGRGEAPRYPKIDSASFNIQSSAGKLVLGGFASRMAAIGASPVLTGDELWFQPSLKLALLLLAVNKRDEAGRYEPLEKGVNAEALARMSRIQWDKYPYSVIVVPGLGPEEGGVALASGGFRRIELAAKNYGKSLAPFILVTGGNVHPSQTPFCEAMEMKKAFIRELGIPADSILVEPQARHTTTNLRNASRLLYRYGFPLDVPALVTTDEAQTSDIRSAEFAMRNEEELGYLPFRHLKPISMTDTAFQIEIDSLQADSSDPLDP